jgi:hypothetical protein
MTQLALDLEARDRRDTSMARVQSKADRVCPGWVAQAESLLMRFLLGRTEPFITEQFAEWAEGQGLPEPHDSRAYGPLMNRAARLHWIVKVGYRTDRWASPKTEWKAAA